MEENRKERTGEQQAGQEVKQIRLIAGVPLHNNVELTICDFGGPKGALRQRGKITVDYAESDIDQLKKQGIDTLDGALAHYRETIYKTVRRYLLMEFVLEDGGWEHLMGLLEKQIKQYFTA